MGELRREDEQSPWARGVNNVVDWLRGNVPGWINLDGDDGVRRNITTGTTTSSNNRALRVRSAAGLHLLVRDSSNTLDLLDVTDTASAIRTLNVTGVLQASSLGVTGNASVGGTLTVVGAMSAAGIASTTTLGVTGNATVGGTLSVTGTTTLAGLSAATATFSGTVGVTGQLNANGDFKHSGSFLGFYGAAPTGRPSITGSRGGNAALADLLSDLDTMGLIDDNTS